MNISEVNSEVTNIVYDFFSDLGFEIDQIDTLDLIQDMGMDSITFVSLIVEIEAKFNIAFPDDYLFLEHFSSVEKIISMLINTLKIDNRFSD